MNVDVAIVGGGPGGCAAALSLRSFAPSLSVVLIEASHYDTPRIGETLPPPARALLEHLGIWDAFLAAGHRPVYGTTSVWGGAAPSDNDFIYTPAANGWHLDRAAFDAMLAKQAASQGTAVFQGRVMDVDGTRLTLNTPPGTGCRVPGTATEAGDAGQLGDPGPGTRAPQQITARFLVDATGGAATIARRRGAFFITSDTLTAFARFFPDPGGDPRTIVEAFAEGWWYTAALPGGARIAACMTDADTGRRLRLHDASAWGAHLSALPHLGTLLGAHLPPGLVTVRPAESRRLDPPAGKDWIAVGDAASRFDPLSSQGIIKALRSGIFASYAVADFLLRGDDTGLTRYRRFIRDEFDSYTEVRTKVYAEEQRWPQSEFWRRRQGAA